MCHVKFTWKNSREFHFYCFTSREIHMQRFVFLWWAWWVHEFCLKGVSLLAIWTNLSVSLWLPTSFEVISCSVSHCDSNSGYPDLGLWHFYSLFSLKFQSFVQSHLCISTSLGQAIYIWNGFFLSLFLGFTSWLI